MDAETTRSETATVRAPEETAKSGEFFIGLIDFDMYFAALSVPRDALKAPRMPRIAA